MRHTAMKPLQAFALSAFALLVVPVHAQSTSATQALADLRKVATPHFSQPAQGQHWTKAQSDAAKAQQAAAYLAAAAQAHDFETKYPNDPNLPEARRTEVTSLFYAVRFGDTADESKAIDAANAFVADASNSRHDRYVIAAMLKQWAVIKQNIKDPAALFAAYQKNASDLYASYSDVPEVYYLFLGLARNAPTSQSARSIATDLLNKPAPANVKKLAQDVLDRLDLPGKTIPLKFALGNGTTFDSTKVQGTPFVIYFWASWGDATIQGFPQIRDAAANTNAIFVGINLDQSPQAQLEAPDGSAPPGPQHWEPAGLDGAVPQALRVWQIPSVYVFDAQGVLTGFGPPSQLASLLTKAGAKPLTTKP